MENGASNYIFVLFVNRRNTRYELNDLLVNFEGCGLAEKPTHRNCVFSFSYTCLKIFQQTTVPFYRQVQRAKHFLQ